MRILALETSTEYCSVALQQDDAMVECCELGWAETFRSINGNAG